MYRQPDRRVRLRKKGNRYIEDRRDILQAAGANTVRALFVLLNLLKGNSETFTQFFLAHAEHGSAKTNSASDMNVDGVRLFLIFGHHAVLTLGWVDISLHYYSKK